MNHFRFEMDQFWDILSVNKDVNGLEFVSTIEAKNYPIFGTQFHPEKNAYEWAPKYPGIPHTRLVKLCYNSDDHEDYFQRGHSSWSLLRRVFHQSRPAEQS